MRVDFVAGHLKECEKSQAVEKLFDAKRTDAACYTF